MAKYLVLGKKKKPKPSHTRKHTKLMLQGVKETQAFL